MIIVHDKKEFKFDENWNELTQFIDLKYFINQLSFKDVLYTQFENSISKSEITQILEKECPQIYAFNTEVISNYTEKDFVELANKFDKTFFILFDRECQNFVEYKKSMLYDNFFIISNSFKEYKNYLDVSINYYLLNAGLQKNTDWILKIVNRDFRSLRSKKYISFNGSHKAHRMFLYKLLKDNQMLSDGFFSYLNWGNTIHDENEVNNFLNFFNLNDKKEYLDFLSNFDIPFLSDTTTIDNHNLISYNVPQHVITFPIGYTLQSYIAIITETKFSLDDGLSISEKVWKPFLGINIPLFFGCKNTYEYLRDYKFDIFDDLFENKTYNNISDILNQFEKNIKIINKMSLNDIHLFYLNNKDRLEYNYHNLKNNSENCINLINRKFAL